MHRSGYPIFGMHKSPMNAKLSYGHARSLSHSPVASGILFGYLSGPTLADLFSWYSMLEVKLLSTSEFSVTCKRESLHAHHAYHDFNFQ